MLRDDPLEELRIVHCSRPAMATGFECWLIGTDEEHLAAAAEAALDEVSRLERLLSRFDPTSELWRINRTAAQRPVLVDVDMLAVLNQCDQWWHATDGYFDIAAATGLPITWRDVMLDPPQRTIQLAHDGVALDLGGFGKGYALDAAAQILSDCGIERFLLHGGTSSVLARGLDLAGRPWPVALRPPAEAAPSAPTAPYELRLLDRALSSSHALTEVHSAASDVIDPQTARPLVAQAGCVVLAPTAAAAEALSTALLAMGKDRAAAYTAQRAAAEVAVGWWSAAPAPGWQWFAST